MIILTDLSEVLISGVYGVDELIMQKYGEQVAEAFLDRCEETKPFFFELMRGHFRERQFWEIFMEEGYWPFSLEEIEDFLSQNFMQEVPGTLDVYKRIIEYPETTKPGARILQGRPEIWIVSDHIAERREEIELYHPEEFRIASRKLWSYGFGLVKEDRGFFERLLYNNRKKPEEVIFVDDMIINLYSASRAGIASIAFIDANHLQREMEEYGFKFAAPKTR